ncbi:hypothetical protein OU789_16195 [Halocynthiibacter sp. C4]|uniref:hypothetical protein n=1 Tax=Halocynthiibacter sp. C4 TaxID=2992758 RepID=UPI00237A4C44|nr:hypothetical protein [Halocynthiibacter sp. C4]MDE0591480.1 hypothetical protein [Halocynthiibacter sp. C4]
MSQSDAAAVLDAWTLTSPTCSARVISAGAMVQDVAFRIPGRSLFRPFAQASWATEDTPERRDQPAHLQNLGGEWPCVPFGTSGADPEHHGYASNANWRCVEQGENHITLEIDFPENHAVKALRRTVKLSQTSPCVDLTLSVSVRRPCRLPIGLHPIFRLPEGATVELSVPGHPTWGTIPAPYRPDGAQLVTAESFGLLDAGGRPVDFGAHVCQMRAELVQAFDTAGRVALSYPEEGVRTTLVWDANTLPHCLIWLANPHDFPGLGEFRGLGVEPVASWFDRGTQPIGPVGGKASGAFGVELSPDHLWTMDYQIRAEPVGHKE